MLFATLSNPTRSFPSTDDAVLNAGDGWFSLALLLLVDPLEEVEGTPIAYGGRAKENNNQAVCTSGYIQYLHVWIRRNQDQK